MKERRNEGMTAWGVWSKRCQWIGRDKSRLRPQGLERRDPETAGHHVLRQPFMFLQLPIMDKKEIMSRVERLSFRRQKQITLFFLSNQLEWPQPLQ